jgi:hypothetical protein
MLATRHCQVPVCSPNKRLQLVIETQFPSERNTRP